MNTPPLSPRADRGSALFIVFIAIALLAALLYALSRSDTGTKGLDNEKLRLTASELIDTGNRFAETTARLRLKGVTETALSFENTTASGYANPNCTTTSCKVFDYDGGGLDWETPPANANNGESWGFSGSIASTDVGTAAPDLIAVLPDISPTLCTQINVLLGIHGSTTAIPTVASATFTKFTGTYALASTISNALTNGKKSACLKISSANGTVLSAPLTDKYYFIQILQSF